MLQTKVIEKIKRSIFCLTIFFSFENRAVYGIMF